MNSLIGNNELVRIDDNEFIITYYYGFIITYDYIHHYLVL